MVRPDASALFIDVADEGGTDGPTGSGTGTSSGTGTGTGSGLRGLAERVALYGGTLDARRLSGGGFRVQARIPLQPARLAHPARPSVVL